jgi:hypothetical protein
MLVKSVETKILLNCWWGDELHPDIKFILRFDEKRTIL